MLRAVGPPAFALHGTVIDLRDLYDGSGDHYVPEPQRKVTSAAVASDDAFAAFAIYLAVEGRRAWS